MKQQAADKLNFTIVDKNKVSSFRLNFVTTSTAFQVPTVAAGSTPLTGAQISLHARDWSNYLERFINEKCEGASLHRTS